MRDNTRRMVAAAKSRRASPEELREARQRLKEIEAELKQVELLPETKQGEEREARYERVLRLRALRTEFQRKVRPIRPDHPNSLLLALVMTIGSFAICAFCVGGAYGVARLIGQKPDPVATGDAFWGDVQNQNYNDIYSNLLYPTLRAQFAQDDFSSQAADADQAYGPVTGYKLVTTPTASDTTTILIYNVTRFDSQRNVTSNYKVTLILTSRSGSWNVSDIGNSFQPSNAGVPEPPTPTIEPTVAPTATATDTTGG